VLTDLRFGARTLWKNPGFAAVAAITITIGVGLNATLFSIVNVFFFKPTPVADAARLVWIAGATSGPQPPRERFTLPDVLDLRASPALTGVMAFGEARMALRAGSRVVRVQGQVVTTNYFTMLGVPTPEGRPLGPADDDAVGETAAVVSNGLAGRLFVSPDEAIGEAIEINGRPFRVVGVAAKGFTGTDVLSAADVWIPMSVASIAGISDPYDRNTWWLRAMARVAPEATLPEAQAAASGIAAGIARAYPASHAGWAVRLVPARGAAPHDRSALAPLALLPAVPLVILLIACANVAALLLARSPGRRREIAVRMALGASRRQIVRLLLAESFWLSLLGGAGSLLLLLWSPDLLIALVGAPLTGDPSPDARVVTFTAALTLATTLLFGLVPAMRASRSADPTALRTGGLAGLEVKTTRLQHSLVAGQLALALVLLSASALFVQSLIEAARVDVGFETQGRVTLSFDLGMQRYSHDRATAFYRALVERASQVPGIRAAAYAAYVPLGGRVAFTPVYPQGQTVADEDRPPTAAVNSIGGDFFETLGLPIVRGRPLDARDAAAGSTAAVVNEAFLRAYAAEGDAIGRRFRLGTPDAPPREIVGVIRDVILDEFGERPRPLVLVPHDGNAGEVSLLAWTAGEPAAALRALEEAVHAIDPAVAVFEPRTMTQHLADRLDGERGLTRLLGFAAALSLGLAGFGLYGAIAYTVSRRTREIGLRLALGARVDDVVRLFVRDGMRVAFAGLAAGVPPALGVGVLLSGTLYGIQPTDLRSLAAASVVLALVALTASYLPTRRATRVDPMVALRTE
jgi:predicted permease